MHIRLTFTTGRAALYIRKNSAETPQVNHAKNTPLGRVDLFSRQAFECSRSRTLTEER